MACRRKRLAVLLEAVQCSYLVSEKSVHRRTSFLGNHDTFWRSSLPRRALQTRARRLAREGPSFTVRTCTTAGGRKWGTLSPAKQRPVCTSWDTYRSFRTPGARPRSYFRNVRHLISAPVVSTASSRARPPPAPAPCSVLVARRTTGTTPPRRRVTHVGPGDL